MDTSNALDTLELLKSKKSEISQLRILLANIEGKVPENKKEDYAKYQHSYEVVQSLSDGYDSWNRLTKEEKKKIERDILEVTLQRDFK